MTAKKKPAAKSAAVTTAQVTGDWSTITDRQFHEDLNAVPADYEETAMAKAIQPTTPLERVRAANAFNNAMISQGDFQLAAGQLDGSFFHVIGSHKLFALLASVFPVAGHGTVRVVDPGPLQQELVNLIGELRDEKAARQRDVTALHKDLNEADASTERSLATLREQRDAAEATVNSRYRDLVGARDEIDVLTIKLARKQELLDEGAASVLALGSELDEAEIRIGHLERALAHEQRGWIAKLFRRPAGGRA